MKKNRLGLWIFSLLAAVSFGSGPYAQSQDIFREMDQVKRDVSALRNEVSDLKNQFYSLREAILKSVAFQDQSASGQALPEKRRQRKSKKCP